MTRRHLFTDLYTEADIAEAERDLAMLMEQHEAEEDPGLRQMLADWIEIDSAWLAEMIESVRGPVLPLRLPIGLPAPGPVWRVH